MAKLRTNRRVGQGRGQNTRKAGSSSGFGASLWRLFVLLLVVLVAIFFIVPRWLDSADQPLDDQDSTGGIDRTYLPTGPSDQVVHHTYYSLGYDEDWEQPRWVAYELTPQQLNASRTKRRDNYRINPAVRTGSASREDYRRSGYSRGHLAPAGDMAFSEQAMSESFFYSNMSPQLAQHNGAVWRELEESARDWVRDKGPTYIISGPIVEANAKRIGPDDVAVPSAFYKVLLTQSGEAIAYIIPHALQTDRLEAFAVSIDEVEQATGLDLFAELPELSTASVESSFDASRWQSNERRYRKRLESWNNNR